MLRRRLMPVASRMMASAAPNKAAPANAAGRSALLTSTAIFGAANALGFGISAVTGWHYHLDLIGTGVFALSALATTGGGEPRQRLSGLGIALWASKLSSFLFYRATLTQYDARLG